MNNYYGAVLNACSNGCALQQYQDCGSGWTSSDQAAYNASTSYTPDPTLTADASTVQDAYKTASASPSTQSPGAPSAPAAPGNAAFNPPLDAFTWTILAGVVAIIVLTDFLTLWL